MKIVLEIEDKSYQTVLDFISLLPENQCRVLPEETDRSNLPDSTKDKQIFHKYRHMVLPVGTTLLIGLTICPKADLSTVLQNHLKLRSKYHLGNDFYRSKLSVDTQFIEITISDPTTMQKELLEDAGGGVFLLFNGLSQTGISTSSIKLPIQENAKDVVVDSLNYAFTRLSEKYEPWRKSHTV
jgi:hypothetical protein